MILRTLGMIFCLNCYVLVAQAETVWRGMNLYVHTPDYNTTEELHGLLVNTDRYLQDINVNAIALTWPVFVDSISGNRVYGGERTPSLHDLEVMSRFFVARGYHVTLRPLIDERNLTAVNQTDWRGTLRPHGVDAWFQSYRQLLSEYARIAESSEAHVVSVGVELTSMEQYRRHWRLVVESVRQQFSGKVTYASNRGISPSMPWEVFDFVAVDAFFDLEVDEHASVEDIVSSFTVHHVNILQDAERVGLPVIFAEIGTTSQQGSFRWSWRWNHRTPVDLSAQARFYEAVCIAWHGQLHGLYWWHISLHPPIDSIADTGFSPQGKPLTEEAIRNCFAS